MGVLNIVNETKVKNNNITIRGRNDCFGAVSTIVIPKGSDDWVSVVANRLGGCLNNGENSSLEGHVSFAVVRGSGYFKKSSELETNITHTSIGYTLQDLFVSNKKQMNLVKVIAYSDIVVEITLHTSAGCETQWRTEPDRWVCNTDKTANGEELSKTDLNVTIGSSMLNIVHEVSMEPVFELN